MSDIEKHIRRVSARIPKALGPSRYLFRRELDRITVALKKGSDEASLAESLEKLSRRVEDAVGKRHQRVENLPKLTFPENLPITDKKDEIIEAIRNHPVVIIAGETGSGKTTQIPKFCLAAGRGIDGKIGCTQPRRIAAVSVAGRIAEEVREPLGKSVGYKIRFHEKASQDAYIKIMTDGILLAETQNDPRLSEYDTIIVDEAHERSLNIDFLLGILKTLLQKRRDLKVIITSATIDTEKFSAAFDGAPIIEVSGRTFPVELRWEEKSEDSEEEEEESGSEPTHVDRAAAAVTKLMKESRSGDVLVFMPTEQDIRETMEILSGKKFMATEILPLFARLTAADQARVFSSRTMRKIIVATNIAETSLTLPGIKYVVDTGLARVSQYNPRTRTTALPVAAISKSSADQRMGRCGRVQNGVCVRLYSEDEYNAKPRFTKPEILRTNLAEVILRMIALKLPDIAEFPFLDRPPEKSIQDGFDVLLELGAIEPDQGDRRWRLTKQGHQMAALPLDPRLSRMLIEAKHEGCIPEISVIVSALSLQDPRERPMEKAAEADRAHAAFKDPLSDFSALLNIWKRYHEDGGNAARAKRFCTKSFISFRRMREWRDIHGQIASILQEHHFFSAGNMGAPREVAGTEPGKGFSPLYAAIHRSILSGFLSNIAFKKEGNLYQACRDRQVTLFPGSGLSGKGPAFIMAAEMVETSRLFARTAAAVDPDWVAPLAGDRCKRSYLDPHWEKSRGQVVATQQVSLYGLILSANQKVSFGAVDPEQATDIFIRSALLAGEVKQPLSFITHNLSLMEEVRDMEDKVRRRDILVSEEDLAVFYHQRLVGVFDIATLNARIRKAGGDKWLRMTEADLVRHRPDAGELSLYPDRLPLGGISFPCSYEFAPGNDADGVTVHIPADAASQIDLNTVDWLVPGLVMKKIEELIKGLPKAYRKQLTPISRAIEVIASEMPRKKEGLLPALSRFIHGRFNLLIPPAAWPEAELPDHLKLRISVTDRSGKVLASGRDKSVLRNVPAPAADRSAFESARQTFEKTDLTEWNFGDIPKTVPLRGANKEEWLAFPALVPDKERAVVHLWLFLDRKKAEVRHPEGVKALAMLCLGQDLKFLKKALRLPPSHMQKATYVGGAAALEGQLFDRVVSLILARDVRTKTAFDALLTEATRRLHSTGQEMLALTLSVLDALHDARTGFHDLEKKFKGNQHVASLTAEIRSNLAALVPDSFIALYGKTELEAILRYIKAMGVRAQKGALDFGRDRKWMDQIAPYTAKLKTLLESLTPDTSEEKRNAVEEFFWMLEEFKVSLFAQEIKTAGPISAKRLDKKLTEIGSMF